MNLIDRFKEFVAIYQDLESFQRGEIREQYLDGDRAELLFERGYIERHTVVFHLFNRPRHPFYSRRFRLTKKGENTLKLINVPREISLIPSKILTSLMPY